ncbi:MAG: ABC transporter ATP-binding protein [Caldilineaceae bacterium]|nr:ABC transporter ATP-binding protein [Caldilineaceae bacterium]
MKPLLEVVDLHKHFGVTPRPQALTWPWRKATIPPPSQLLRAVDGINFTIDRGECVGLVGQSGSGKSTLIRMLARLTDPTSGHIYFEGQPICQTAAGRFAQHPLRPRIQMVFQSPTDSLNGALSASAIIADPLRCLAGMTNKRLIQERVEELATLVGLPHELLTRYPHQLSGGQKARVGIARAIAPKPALLLLDEPTTALDVSVQAIILQLLDELRHRLGMGYLFITHDLNVVRLLSNRILVMQAGKIVEEGRTDQLFAQPTHTYTRTLLSAIP